MEHIKETLRRVPGSNPFTGLYVTTPSGIEVTPESRELFRLTYHEGIFSQEEARLCAELSTLMAEEMHRLGINELSLTMLCSLIYSAGKIDGIRKERARKKAR